MRQSGKNMVEPDRSQMTIYDPDKIRFSCWTTKTKTQTRAQNF